MSEESVERGQHVTEEAEQKHGHGGPEVLEVAKMVEDEHDGRHDVAQVAHAHGLAVYGVFLALDPASRGAGGGPDQQGVVHGVTEPGQDVPLTDALCKTQLRHGYVAKQFHEHFRKETHPDTHVLAAFNRVTN